MQDPEKHNNFYFVSDSGARFDIDFIINESIIPSGAYEFGITNRRHERSPLTFHGEFVLPVSEYEIRAAVVFWLNDSIRLVALPFL